MAAKRKIDWPQVAALAVVLAAVVALLVWVEPEKAETWLAMVPGILGAVGLAYSMTRGRAVGDPVPVPAPRVRRERDTEAPPPGEP